MSLMVVVFADGSRTHVDRLELDIDPDEVVIATDAAGNVFIKQQGEDKTVETVLLIPRELFVRAYNPDKVKPDAGRGG